ncbi:MAG: hypothetical protein UW03_C0033G0001, partial [Candidatus Peregrinibacteria bacterium GW2011_GWA2_43_8]
MSQKQSFKTHLHDSEKGYDKYASSYDKKTAFLREAANQAMAFLAAALTRTADKMIIPLQRLIDEYPNHHLVPEAQFTIGDYYYNK